jgi:geranylgeranyl diphosphate synthase type I
VNKIIDLLDDYREGVDKGLVHYLGTKLSEKYLEKFYPAMRHLPFGGGKRLRPILSVLSAEAVGGSSDDSEQFGLGVELLHNSSLVHDDIIDNDIKRRGIQTVHAKYGEQLAITAGDGLFSEAFYVLTTLPLFRMEHHGMGKIKDLFVSIALGLKDLYGGQAMDQMLSGDFSATEEEYIAMVSKKTGGLYWLSTRGGAILGGGNEEQIEALSNFGRTFGVMFQIKDDLLGLDGNEDKLGKSVGIDIRDRSPTLYLIYALQHADKEDKEVLKKLLSKEFSKEDIEIVRGILKRAGSLEHCRLKLEELKDEAKSYLSILDESEVKDTLIKITDWSVERDN